MAPLGGRAAIGNVRRVMSGGGSWIVRCIQPCLNCLAARWAHYIGSVIVVEAGAPRRWIGLPVAANANRKVRVLAVVRLAALRRQVTTESKPATVVVVALRVEPRPLQAVPVVGTLVVQLAVVPERDRSNKSSKDS